MYDSEGNLFTIDNCVMRGSVKEDQTREASLYTEANFTKQTGDWQRWWNRHLNGADTSDPREGQAFS